MNIWFAEIWRAWRASLRHPGFLLLAASVLALGVGASAGVFTLIDNVLLKPLPYTQPSQLVSVGRASFGRQVSPWQYQHLKSLSGVHSMGLVWAETTPANVTGGGRPEQVSSLQVDHGLLPTLGVRMQLGRNFNADEDRPNGPRTVILTNGFWHRRYGGDMKADGPDRARQHLRSMGHLRRMRRAGHCRPAGLSAACAARCALRACSPCVYCGENDR